MFSQIKILSVCPSPIDATSYYRGMMPLADLGHRKNIEVIGIFGASSISWPIMAACDILFLQRPFLKEHLQMAEMAEKLGRSVWCDWDDDLFCVPDDNPANAVYKNKEIQNNIAQIAARADVITVSTSALKERFDNLRKLNDLSPSVMIPNALSDHLIHRRKEPTDAGQKIPNVRRPLVFWRGSQTHMKDLMGMSLPIVKTMNANQDFALHFLGYNPFWISNALNPKKVISGEALDVLDYHTYLQQIQPGILIVPLDDSPFNRAKSRIAAIEGAFAHAQIIAPYFEEWRIPGVYLYKDEASFEQQLTKAMDDVRKNNWIPVIETWQHVVKNLRLSQMNEKRWQLIKMMAYHKPQGSETESYATGNDKSYWENFNYRWTSEYRKELAELSEKLK